MYRNPERQPLLDLQPPHSHNVLDRRRDCGPYKLPQPTPSSLEASLRYGLQTPPEDIMGTTYQNPHYGTYPRPDVQFPSSARTSGHTASYSISSSHSRSSSALSQPPMTSTSTGSTKMDAYSNQASTYSHSASPQQEASRQDTQSQQGKNGVNDQIMANLQIPKTINSSGGSLAEFAAQITCLFWFETTDTLKEAEQVTPSTIVPRLKTEALPTTGFRKWVVTTLTTTQVSQNVILLALLFIYRLKNSNPGVKGRCGSEYRLLTVALMLGNKFLDDNTYTNKTWAEVSGISVTEIHVMEVEFLSNMRYTLLASQEQWAEWQQKLAKFWIYCDNAGKLPSAHIPTQGISVLQPMLPSPPISLQSSPPSGVSSQVTTSSILNTNPSQPAQQYNGSRKRASDELLEEPSAKRVSRLHTTIPAQHPSMQDRRGDAVRLPVPNLTISTTLPMTNGSISAGYQTPSNLLQNVPVLPPLSGRAMSTVYPPTSQPWTPNPPLLTPTGPLPATQSSGYSTPSRRHSPHTVQELLSLGSSPISGHFPHTQGHISPSFFLQQRSSPYRPVRHVDTLLYPPPSASMHEYAANIDQIQYQPLGRRNDYRQGVVPHYPQSNYSHGPAIRQPNFGVKPTPTYGN